MCFVRTIGNYSAITKFRILNTTLGAKGQNLGELTVLASLLAVRCSVILSVSVNVIYYALPSMSESGINTKRLFLNLFYLRMLIL